MRLRLALNAASRRVRRALALAALLAAGVAGAAPRISLGPLRGAPAPALARDLQWALCDAFDCEPWPRVSSGGLPDLAKARRRGVDGILTGFVAEPRGRPVLWLYFTDPSDAAPAKWQRPLNRQRTLDAAALRLLAREIRAQLAGRARAAPGRAPPPPIVAPTEALGVDLAPAREPAPSSPPSPPPRVDPAPLPPPPVVAPRAAPRTVSPLPPAAARASAPAAASRRWLAVEVGAFVVRRALRFEGAALGASQLRAYDAKAIAGPEARLELFPAARSSDGLAAGLGVFASYGRSVELKTRTEAGAARASELSRLSLGATWRSPPLSALRLVVAPSLSYRALNALVEPAITGLADARLSGVKGGLDLEIGSGRRLSLLLGGGYVRWTTAQDLIKGEVAFFPGGSASAIELEAGLALAIAGSFSLHVRGEYGSTRYAFDPDPTGVYSARGAKDTYAGGRFSLRASY